MSILGKRRKKNQFTTHTGNTFRVNRSLSDKIKIRKDQKTRKRAERLGKMPKSRFKRFFYRMSPANLKRYWLSREGGVMALKVMGISFIGGFLLLVGLFAYFRKDLPKLDTSGDKIGGSIRYYDRSGKTLLWEDYDAVKRYPTKSYDDISQYMKDATVAIEDKEFFNHGGFDLRGITRAVWSNATGSGNTQGGSTITQQWVKLTQNWTQERTYARKIKEVILAVETERTYSKKDILKGYLDTAPYGNVQYGVESATRDYFQKSAKDLTLDESAFMAAIPQSPSYYSPYGASYNKDAVIGRQHYILDLMQHQGMITAEQRDAAKKVNTLKKVKKSKPKYAGILAPWFVLTAKQQLQNDFISNNSGKVGGWKVTTTLDMKLQKIAEEKVAAGMGQIRSQRGDSAAFAAEDVETGQMVTLVGGADFYTKTKFNEINFARAPLPPGSSFKPYDYAALIENSDNFGAGSVLYDTKGALEGYACTRKGLPPPRGDGDCLHDYDFRFPGALTLRYALGGSRNVPAVKAMLVAGVDKTIGTAEKLGLKSGYKCYQQGTNVSTATPEDEVQCGASSAIGDGAYLKLDEHVHALGSLSRLGENIPQTYILKIDDAANKEIYKWKKEKGTQAIRPDTAYIISDMLSDPRASYMSRKSHDYNGWKFALKTGTTNDAKDGWLTGYSAKYAAAVWVGHSSGRVEMSGFMENMTQPIWGGWMQEAHNGHNAKNWSKPNGVKTAAAYVVRSHVGVSSIEPSPTQDLYPSWYQNNKKRSSAKQTIDIVSNKIATSCTPERAKKVLTETSATSFSGDTFVDSGGNAANQKDDIHKCSDSKPSIRLSIKDSGGGSYNLVATVSGGTHPLSSDKFKGKVEFSVGGEKLGNSPTVSSSGSVTYKNYTPNFNGSKTITATVIDSVLYDNSDSGTITGVGGAPSITSATSDGFTSSNFTWSGGVGTIKRSDNDEDVCSGDGSCPGPALSPGTRVYVQTASGPSKAKKITSPQ